VDSLITAAARALAVGDPLGALKRIALREDPPALALRGTAMAQLGDLPRARALLRQAARAYGPREALSRARCTVAEAEIALASRDLSWSPKSLSVARETLEEHGDHVNAAHAGYLETRRLLLVGRLDEAEHSLEQFDPSALPPPLRAAHEMVVAGIAVRRVQATAARLALSRAARAARQAGIPALAAEVEAASRELTLPAARLIAKGTERNLRLDEVEALLSSSTLVMDACRFTAREGDVQIELAKRPVLFAIARALAESWPEDVSRETLVARAFRAKRVDDTYRARLRVEVGRLRGMLRKLADVVATRRGFAISPRRAPDIVVLARPVEDEHAAVLALLTDGESWSTSALSLALGVSPRTVQRALGSLVETGKVQALGAGRARRWMTPPPPGFTTTLLLPTPLPSD
jgi:DNA-binding winged helix-turn-helix (wHTH) protein